jgi:hypothetical protein
MGIGNCVRVRHQILRGLNQYTRWTPSVINYDLNGVQVEEAEYR